MKHIVNFYSKFILCTSRCQALYEMLCKQNTLQTLKTTLQVNVPIINNIAYLTDQKTKAQRHKS